VRPAAERRAAFCPILLLFARRCAKLRHMSATDSRVLSGERRELMLRWLREEGRLRASEVAERLDVSLDTVRRDLQELAEAGALHRVHGGALPPRSPGPDGFAERRSWQEPERASVAAAGARLLRAGEVIALAGGNTTTELARRFAPGFEATVLTTSPDVAAALAEHPGLTVDLAGGRLHPRARTVTGADALEAMRAVRPHVCVLSACSLHPAAGLTLRFREEAEVVRLMLEQAERVVALVTASKLGTTAPYPVAPADRIDQLVTDASDEDIEPFEALGIEVVRA
jgi:DeoR/GlpR family transcriptional regulator of sugar metabolism